MDQTLYFGGPILTMEGEGCAQALLIQGERIQYVGELAGAQALARPEASRIDLEGRALLPAFVDAHSHLTAYANSFLQVPLGECADGRALAARLADFVRDRGVKPGEWVRGEGYDHNALAEGRHPDRTLLDAACPNNPVIVTHRSGHVGAFNTRALEMLEVDENTPCPSGGKMALGADGRLTGYMEENAFLDLQRRVPMPALAELMEAYEKAQAGYASYGVTTVQEGMMTDQLVPLYQALLPSGRLKLDVVGYADTQSPGVFAAFSNHVGAYRGRFKLGGYKIFLDGSPQGRTAWMRTPYAGPDRGYRGYPTLTDGQVYDRMALALDRGVQLLAHCNGDGAAEQYLSALARLEARRGARLERPVMIHAQLLDLDQLDRVKELGVIPSFFTAHVYHWGEVHVQNFGLERASRISPAGAALARGIPFTFHQDTPVVAPDMLETVWCAVNRLTKTGRTLGPEQRIPVEEALKAVTLRAAWQYFEEGEKGSLRPGKRADLVLLDRDPLTARPEELRDIRVLATWKDGRLIYRRSGQGRN